MFAMKARKDPCNLTYEAAIITILVVIITIRGNRNTISTWVDGTQQSSWSECTRRGEYGVRLLATALNLRLNT